jgi:hypothetical protein
VSGLGCLLSGTWVAGGQCLECLGEHTDGLPGNSDVLVFFPVFSL